METTTAAIVDSATTSTATQEFTGQPEDGFREFQKAQREKSSVPTTEKPQVKAVPASEPVKDKPKQEPLTDEQKSEAKRLNNERRWAARERELASLKAENERLRQSAAKGESATPAKPVVQADTDKEPKEEDYKNDPEGFRKYVKDLNAWEYRQNEKAANERRAQETVQASVQEQAKSFMGKIQDYAKEHDGFYGTAEEPGAFETVRDALEDTLPDVSAAIAGHDRAPELIDYLGTNPEAFDKILAHEGNPARALIELGKIVAAHFDNADPVEAEPKPKAQLPKPPKPVSQRATPASGQRALEAAAESNDFSAFQKHYYGDKGRSVPPKRR